MNFVPSLDARIDIWLYNLLLRYCWSTSIPISATAWHTYGSYSWLLLYCNWSNRKVGINTLLYVLSFSLVKIASYNYLCRYKIVVTFLYANLIIYLFIYCKIYTTMDIKSLFLKLPIIFSECDRYFAVGSADSLVSLWDISQMLCERTFTKLEWVFPLGYII